MSFVSAWGGIPVRVSPLAVRTEVTHHLIYNKNRRRKRWSVGRDEKVVPAVFVMNTKLLSIDGKGEEVLVVHPSIAAQLGAVL